MASIPHTAESVNAGDIRDEWCLAKDYQDLVNTRFDEMTEETYEQWRHTHWKQYPGFEPFDSVCRDIAERYELDAEELWWFRSPRWLLLP